MTTSLMSAIPMSDHLIELLMSDDADEEVALELAQLMETSSDPLAALFGPDGDLAEGLPELLASSAAGHPPPPPLVHHVPSTGLNPYPPADYPQISPMEPPEIDDDDLDDPNDEAKMDEKAWKRRRHREAMQRCRERKRSRMGALEKEQRHLQQQLRRQLLDFQQRRARAELAERQQRARPQLVADVDGDHDMATDKDADAEEHALERLRQAFAEVVSIKEALLSERKALEQSLLDHRKFEKLLDQASTQMRNEPTLDGSGTARPVTPNGVNGNDSDTSQGSQSGPSGGIKGHWVEFIENEPPMFYEPESDEQMNEHIRECYQRVRRLQAGFQLQQFPSIAETHCLGWCAQRSLVWNEQHQRVLRFRFFRRIPQSRATLDLIQRESWRVLSTPELNVRLYSSHVVAKIVQRVDDDTFIFLRNSPDKDRRLNIRYFSMHSQMEYRNDANERAAVTLMLLLDKEAHVVEDTTPGRPPTAPVIWLKEGTLFLNFTEKPRQADELEDAIEIEYGGSVRCLNDEHAQYLLIEIGGMLMRWEHLVIPPRLLHFF